ncbi:hypothetical protein OEZ85_010279 [Tetradesmus obliquus]|uniref:Methyltransferase small domain-containing protein n=1 Tax=Tetradesmus obliquus TaxID=3088 RepID=A0ABY8TMF2_TETOB|nr:hypothetical protein OEZ85_010279 [Tetradesmus obliquus]
MASHLETDSSVGMADQQQKQQQQQQQQKQQHDKLKEEQQEPHVDDLGCVRDIELTDDHTLHVAEQHGLADDCGCVVWDAALVLVNYLAKQVEIGRLDLRGKRVIELGAGTGVVGLTAAALGAAEVLLTDLPHHVQHISGNIKRNGLHHIATAAALQWGQQPLPAPVAAPYDIVLCSDLVYQQHAVQQLLSSMRDLAGPGSVIFASCEYREGAGLEEMWRLMPAYGLQEELVPYTDLHEDWCSPDILVWKIIKQQQKQGKQAPKQIEQQ